MNREHYMRGKLLYLVGASGSGKDSLLDGCRQRLKPQHGCFVAHRYITRAVNIGGENHIHLSEDEFEMRVNMGMFAMQWYSHGYSYAVGSEVENWLANGINVVMNGSREYLPFAMHSYPNLIPVLVDVDAAVLRERLTKRGREAEDEIEARLQRHDEIVDTLPDDVRRIDNNGEVQYGVAQLLKLIEELAPAEVAPSYSTH
ncbi:phosphonate metabolism protein/1,5-bisphosphokinase (PRPP-forming) PhnN [Aliamphritea ceti]|uniref:phosphonate metabolism protein/1,5-bisphosphokinase (PRPP-forming) PhnN n=1 Tax=Aliamphritea ceti TaxID=1524258 RepID=UPI0021C398B3|nr:phosphonate metabolism protein/1,5-bisphosphokinase (PRPP-forming) PhnN [Aliamphritea ceti]